MNRRTSEQYLEQLVAWGPAPSKPVQSAGRVSSMQCGCPAPTSSIMPVCNSTLFVTLFLPTLYCVYPEPILANGVWVWVVACVCWGGGIDKLRARADFSHQRRTPRCSARRQTIATDLQSRPAHGTAEGTESQGSMGGTRQALCLALPPHRARTLRR